MASTPHDGPEPREFLNVDLAGARFLRTNLAGAVMRGVNADGLSVDDPWLYEGGSLVVNGVDVALFVDSELNRRFPGRSLRRASNPEGLREAWTSLESTWAATVERAQRMPAGTVDASVGGEWTFAQTLRHLVMATDVWLRRAALQLDEPLHPIGQPHAEYAEDGNDLAVFSFTDPSFDDVLAVRAERQAMVRGFLAQVTPAQLQEERQNPWWPVQVTVLSCVQTILEEEWEHHRYAVRDLDAIESAT